MATSISHSSLDNTPRSRRPFMQLDLQNVPKNYTTVTFHQQCYKLVPDLSPDDQIDTAKAAPRSDAHVLPDTYVHSDHANVSKHHPHKRRQLPEIPIGKRPLERLWQSHFDRARQMMEMGSSFKEDQANTVNGTPDSAHPSNNRWTRKLSTNMLLEIETDCLTGRALSLRLINDEDDQMTSAVHKSNRPFSPATEEDCLSSFTSDGTGKAVRDHTTSHRANASDSGVSSNMQSPTISTNSECNEYAQANNPKDVTEPSLKLPEATHRALYKFCARQSDQLDLEIGDPIYVHKEFDDQWSDGVNIRTGSRGIFPSPLATDLEYSEFTVDLSSLQPNLFDQEHALPSVRTKRERFLLDFLGSIEVNEPKGEEVLNEAVSRVSADHKSTDLGLDTPCQCVLEISDIGLRMMDHCVSGHSKSTVSSKTKLNRMDYFFSLLQITYCGYRTRLKCYFFAFVTRHPSDQSRFACHVFRAHNNTREVAEAMGRAFHRFYNRFIELTRPLETFYLDH